jgi:hypothetical protein
LIAGPDSPRVSVHHVLFAHHRSRCPALAAGPAELINSVVYDCQDGFVHHNPADGEFHIAGNTFIHGPSHEDFTPIYLDDEDPGGTTYWLSQNEIQAPDLFEGVLDDITTTPLAEAAFEGADPSQLLDQPSDFGADAEGYVPISMQAPAAASEAVLEQAGAFPRDAVTAQTIDDVRTGSGSWGATVPDDLLEGLAPAEPPLDADADGMADDWEAERGLDPADGDDHGTVGPSGYTAIEEYVNELAEEIVGASPPAATTEAPAAERSIEEGAAPGADPDAGADVAAPVSGSGGGGGVDGTLVVALLAAVLSVVAVAVSGYTLGALRRRS